MKNSNIKWIGIIPDRWTIKKVKQCFYISKEQAKEKNPIVLSLARAGIKVRDISTNEGQLAASYENYNPVVKGDLLLNPMDLYSGAHCNVSEVCGVISPAYVNLKKKIDLNPKFFDYYFKVQYWTMAMFAHGKGVSFDNRWTMNSDAVLNYYVPFPSLEEQNAIVQFINDKITSIESLIEVENQQINTLDEYKKAIVNDAVTKGINKNVEYKYSGIDSIGMIPVHWNIMRTKYVCDSLSKGCGITKEEVFADGDIGCIRYGEIYTSYDYLLKECVSKTFENRISTKSYVEYGDILFSGTGELVEEIGKNIVYIGKDKCLAGGDIIIAKHHQDPCFFNYALASNASQIQKSNGKAKLKVVHISATNIGNIYVAIPPIDEQIVIGEYLNEKIESINKIINIKKIKIDKLNELKKSIIYEYITGKKELI